ncbi:MAG: sigma-70 family RNA polymerase sigma factor [Chitinophagaceae bacterium]
MSKLKNDFIDCLKTYAKDLFSYTIAKVQQKETAEDLVQETFLSAYHSYENYKEKSNVKTWLFSILKHKIADYFRLKYKNSFEISSNIINEFFDEDDRWKPEYRPQTWNNEKELLDNPEFAKALKNCFDKLPEKWLSAIHLKYLEEENSKTICSKLEITTSNFWQIIHRAKLQLRNCLELGWFKNNLK